jgi:hypothetical protein
MSLTPSAKSAKLNRVMTETIRSLTDSRRPRAPVLMNGEITLSSPGRVVAAAL